MRFEDVKGFGAKRIKAMEDAGFSGPADLLGYFPVRYIDTGRLTDLAAANDGDQAVILARTETQPKVAYVRRNLTVVKVKFVYGDLIVYASWFNQPFIAKSIVAGKYYFVYGKLKRTRSSFEITGPKLLKFSGEGPAVIPIYRPIGKVGSALIADAIAAALGAVKVQGYIPRYIAEKYGLGDADRAFREVHMPQTSDEVADGKRTLAVERLSYMLAAYSLIRAGEDDKRLKRYDTSAGAVGRALSAFPYELTAAQKRALDSIISGMGSDKRLNVLLEGDVGCGKTAVAFVAMYVAAASGHQAAMMAPTEILAYQHFVKAKEYFANFGIECAYFAGSLSKKERELSAEAVASGRAKCVFGTHALLGQGVTFFDLALVITDEQHRFGVAQRAALENKTAGADSIVMSATPIPRTLALTLYGDLDRLTIDALPPGRATIRTSYVPAARESSMWDYVEGRAARGEQTFVVVPRIADDEDDDRTAAEAVYRKYAPRFGSAMALLHGKMKDAVKNSTMRAFADGEIKILVATTVVEVGIDVPAATTMIIYDADRLGLAQLHQLRGRVGRGTVDSWCFVLSGSASEESVKRLERFIACSDGFELAEYDFASRGAGDFLGYDQHGSSGFPTDPDTVLLCRKIKDDMLSDPAARDEVGRSIGTAKYDYLSGVTLN